MSAFDYFKVVQCTFHFRIIEFYIQIYQFAFNVHIAHNVDVVNIFLYLNFVFLLLLLFQYHLLLVRRGRDQLSYLFHYQNLSKLLKKMIIDGKKSLKEVDFSELMARLIIFLPCI